MPRRALREAEAALAGSDAPSQGRPYTVMSLAYRRLGLAQQELDACLSAHLTDPLVIRTSRTTSGGAWGVLRRHAEALHYFELAAQTVDRTRDIVLPTLVALNPAALGRPGRRAADPARRQHSGSS
jgi:hypothetical protein